MVLLSALDAHDTGAMDRIDAMPKRQEAIPALRRRLGRTCGAAVECSLAAAAGQVKDAAQQSAPDGIWSRQPVETTPTNRLAGWGTAERAPWLAVAALNISYFLHMDSACG